MSRDYAFGTPKEYRLSPLVLLSVSISTRKISSAHIYYSQKRDCTNQACGIHLPGEEKRGNMRGKVSDRLRARKEAIIEIALAPGNIHGDKRATSQNSDEPMPAG